VEEEPVFGSIGAPELIFIFLIALLVFGPRKLPQLGRTIGKSLGEFRRATHDLKSSLEREVTEEEIREADPESTDPGGKSEKRDEGEGGGPE
jgi:TatA/E family protein of Tat protein translocase